MILGSTSTAPPGYTLSGANVTGNVVSKAASPSFPAVVAEGTAAVAANGLVYAMGGYNPTYTSPYLNDFESYDPSVNAWSKKPPMITARAFLATCSDSGVFYYAIGGSNASGALSTVEVYDAELNTWSAFASLTTPRSGLAAVIDPATHKIDAIGGFTGANFTSTVETMEVYDRNPGKWLGAPPMPTPRSGLTAVLVNGQIYAIGGRDRVRQGSQYRRGVQRSPRTRGQSYRPCSSPDMGWPQSPQMERSMRSMELLHSNNLYAPIYHNTVEAFDPAANQWTEVLSPSLQEGLWPLRFRTLLISSTFLAG